MVEFEAIHPSQSSHDTRHQRNHDKRARQHYLPVCPVCDYSDEWSAE